jgi:hypothetical protein
MIKENTADGIISSSLFYGRQASEPQKWPIYEKMIYRTITYSSDKEKAVRTV